MSANTVSAKTGWQDLLEKERALFDQDYQRHYRAGETKPRQIGQPYLLHRTDSSKGVLLVHGLMAAPEEVRQLADFLFGLGYSVYAPRMAGHGTSADDLSMRGMDEWIASVDRGYEILACCCEQIVVAGFSTGGAVALHQVITKPEAFAALICISAPLKFKKFSARLAVPVNNWNRLLRTLEPKFPVRFFRIKRLRKEFVTNHADNPDINYLRCPVNGIVQIQRLMKVVCRGLPSIVIPSLIIHATQDPKVDVQSSRDIFRCIRSPIKRYREIEFNRHGIVRGEIAQEVFKTVESFLHTVFESAIPVCELPLKGRV
jgi:carboxylesterase